MQARTESDIDLQYRGTCMVSCVGGKYAGAFKDVEIVVIKIFQPSMSAPLLDKLLRATALAQFDVRTSAAGVIGGVSHVLKSLLGEIQLSLHLMGLGSVRKDELNRQILRRMN